MFLPQGQGKCLCWGPGVAGGGRAGFPAGQPAKGCRHSDVHPQLQPCCSARAAPWEGLGIRSPQSTPSLRSSPGLAFRASPAGAKPCKLQVPWNKQRTSGTLPPTLFREMALGLCCHLHPSGLVGSRASTRLVRSTLQPCHTRESCKCAIVLTLKEHFTS